MRTLLRQLAYIRTALGSLEVESSITNLEERGDLPSVTQWSGLESSPLVPSPVFFLPHKHPPHGLQTKACIMNEYAQNVEDFEKLLIKVCDLPPLPL